METWPDELDLVAWRQAYRSLQDPGSLSCPPEDRLIALVLHEPTHAERAELADHIVRCRRCTDLYQLLLRVRHDRMAARPAPAPPEAAVPAEGIVENKGERVEKQTPAPPLWSMPSYQPPLA
jgi:hypothetical protein